MSKVSKTKLTKEEVNQMSQLEQLFHNKYLTSEFLKQLTSIYVKAIQYFSDEHFMKNYFMDKMKFVLSRPEINTILGNEESLEDTIRETVRVTERNVCNQEEENKKDDSPFDIPVEKDETDFTDQKKNNNPTKTQTDKFPKTQTDRFPNYQQNQHHHHKHERHQHKHEEHHHHNYFYNENKNENKGNQAKSKLDMKFMLMREVEEQMKNVTNQVQEADKKFRQKKQIVKGIGQTQQDKLKERLEKRKNKKLRKKSVEIKPNVLNVEGQQPEPEQIVKKEELVEDQRKLTEAVMKFTVRMTERLRRSELGSSIKLGQKMKKAKQLDNSQVLVEEPDEEGKQDTDQNKEKRITTRQYQIHEYVPQDRVKTTRRQLDSDQDS